jgi:hypothetical protein
MSAELTFNDSREKEKKLSSRFNLVDSAAIDILPSTGSRAESDSVIGLLVGRAMEESSSIIVSIGISPRAAGLEVTVVGDTYANASMSKHCRQMNLHERPLTRGRTLVRGVELTGAAVPRVGWVSVQVGAACRLASDRET